MHNSCTFIFNINKNILLIIPCLKMYCFVFLFVCFFVSEVCGQYEGCFSFVSGVFFISAKSSVPLQVFTCFLNPCLAHPPTHFTLPPLFVSSPAAMATSVSVCLPLCDGARCQSGNQHSERLAVLPQQPFLFLHATLKPDLFSLRRHTHLSLRPSIPPAAC